MAEDLKAELVKMRTEIDRLRKRLRSLEATLEPFPEGFPKTGLLNSSLGVRSFTVFGLNLLASVLIGLLLLLLRSCG